MSGDLTSDAGNSGPAAASLVVAEGRIGFTKDLSPGAVQVGAKSRLTFTLDNPGGPADSIEFNDFLPGGIEVADPRNRSTPAAEPSPPRSARPC